MTDPTGTVPPLSPASESEAWRRFHADISDVKLYGKNRQIVEDATMRYAAARDALTQARYVDAARTPRETPDLLAREIALGGALIRALRAMDIEVPAEEEIDAGVAAMRLELEGPRPSQEQRAADWFAKGTPDD